MVSALKAKEVGHRSIFYFAFIASYNNPNLEHLYLDEQEFYSSDIQKYMAAMGFSRETIKGVVNKLEVTTSVPIHFSRFTSQTRYVGENVRAA